MSVRSAVGRRWIFDRVGYGLAGLVAALFILELVTTARSDWAREWAFAKGDLNGYLAGARRFLETGSPYLPEQLNPWVLGGHSFIHPPSALPLFVPFLWLPSILWWAVPMVGTSALIWVARPGPWRLLVIGLCLVWPRSVGSILAGNSDLWSMFFVALGLQFGWPFVLLVVKPTFAPLALLGIRDRSLWVASLVVLVAMLPLIPLWVQYVTVIRGTTVGLAYSILNLPLVMLPVAALPLDAIRRRPTAAS